MISDNEMRVAFAGTNFGTADLSNLVERAVLKVLCGFDNGRTLTKILKDLGLVTPLGKVTEKGKQLCFSAYYARLENGQ